MRELTLAIVKKGTGKYAVLRRYNCERISSPKDFFKENKEFTKLVKKKLSVMAKEAGLEDLYGKEIVTKDGVKISLFLYYFYIILDYLLIKEFDYSDLRINKTIEIEYDGIMYWYKPNGKLLKEKIGYEEYGGDCHDLTQWGLIEWGKKYAGYKYINEQKFDCFNSALKAAKKVFEARKEVRKDEQFEVVKIITEDLK
ncbi:MAG: hypothetical protein ACTSWT_11225 [Candidatus Heimdallarchaeota archaeon]